MSRTPVSMDKVLTILYLLEILFLAMKLCVLFQISTILHNHFSEKVTFSADNVFNTFVFCSLSSHFLKTETIHLTFWRSKQLIN